MWQPLNVNLHAMLSGQTLVNKNLQLMDQVTVL